MNEVALGDNPMVRVWFTDVGQGDCTIIIDEETKNALVIDCPSSHVDQVRDILEREQGNLHTCIVTHWDADHYAGVARLAVSLPVNRVMYNHDTLFQSENSPPFAIRGALKEFLDIPRASEVLNAAEAGTSGDFGQVSWQLLAPTHYEVTMAYVARKRNIASAVVDVSVPSARILIGGDAVGRTWERLLAEYSLEADVLRWPHHGAELAGDSTGRIRDSVIHSVAPKFVIISTGSDNTYGHPSSSVIHHVKRRAAVMCTQVTAGCLGYLLKVERQTSPARDAVNDLDSTYCAGSIRMDCFADTYTVSPSLEIHDKRIDKWSKPMCRVAPTKPGEVSIA